MPVLASNQVLAWHMLRLAGISDVQSTFGKLFEAPLPKSLRMRRISLPMRAGHSKT